VTRCIVRLLAAAVLSAFSLAQDTAPNPARPADRSKAASALLEQIDGRIYSAERAGLVSVEFFYRPTASGPREVPGFRVHVRWEKGKREEVEFRQADGSPFATLPDLLTKPSPVAGAPSARDTFEQGAKGLADVFRGVSYSERFARWAKVLQTRIVNGREERTIVCEPSSAGRFLRAEITIDAKGMPWRLVHYLSKAENGMDRMIDEPVWGDFDGKMLMTSFKKTWGPISEEVEIKYQRKAGFLVPASYEKHAPGKPPVQFVFEDVKVNEPRAESGPASRPAQR
jgi:hypothetical protein